MSNARPSKSHTIYGLQRLVGRFINTSAGARLANLGPVAWATRIAMRNVARSHIGNSEVPRNPSARIADTDLESTLKSLLIDVVDTLGYVGAMVVTYEPGGAPPMHVWYLDPASASEQQMVNWEAVLAQCKPDQFIGPIASASSSVYATQLNGRTQHPAPVITTDLFDMLRPAAPEATHAAIKDIQAVLGVQQIVAVPFFLETLTDDTTTHAFVGNLFALSKRHITPTDQQVLAAFGRQAAASILSDRRRLHTQAVLRLIFDIQTNLSNEAQVLEQIVRGVVTHLGYAGALVATYQPDGALPVQAWYLDPAIVSEQQVRNWETQITQFTPDQPVSLSNPDTARVYVDHPAYSDNLSSKAFKRQGPVTSSTIFDLFRPIVPPSSIPLLQGIQEALQVRQVIAVPFFLHAPENTNGRHTFVGNLFALSRSAMFNSAEIEMLRAFGQQAAAGLHNARLYQQAENRRKAAEIFGKMAFSASASVHDLKNKVGVVRGNLQVLKILPLDQLAVVRDDVTEPLLRNLDQMADMLDTLHEPWQQVPDTLIQINVCLQKALAKVLPTSEIRDRLVERKLASTLPEIRGSHDMLIEAFKVVIKNAVEAVSEKGTNGRIELTSACLDGKTIEISISDNGVGIKPEDLGKVFEMRWSTKNGNGLGFGLFWARDYVEGLHGALSVKSIYGEGSTFQISIPITI